MKITVNAKVEIETDRISDLFTNAIEGGSNYWCVKIRPITDTDLPAHEYMLSGFKAWIDEPFEDGDKLKYVCDKADIESALQLMATDYPQDFSDMINENDDASTGDVFLQLCLFKKVIFG